MSRLAVLKDLKNDPTTAAIPVMMLSGFCQQNEKHFERYRSHLLPREVRFDAIRLTAAESESGPLH